MAKRGQKMSKNIFGQCCEIFLIKSCSKFIDKIIANIIAKIKDTIISKMINKKYGTIWTFRNLDHF